jgi:transposase-like protein
VKVVFIIGTIILEETIMSETKLTPEITEIICQYIEKGNSYETAAQAVGICRPTIYNWMERGEKGEEPFLQFLQSIKKAKAKSEIRHIDVIDKAMEKNWQAAAWWLERSNQSNWGIRTEQKIEHTGKTDQPIIFQFNHTTSTTSVPTKTTTDTTSNTNP